MSISQEEIVISDDNNHSDNTQVGGQINKDNTLCVLNTNNVNVVGSNSSDAGSQVLEKAADLEQGNRLPKHPNKSNPLSQKPSTGGTLRGIKPLSAPLNLCVLSM